MTKNKLSSCVAAALVVFCLDLNAMAAMPAEPGMLHTAPVDAAMHAFRDLGAAGIRKANLIEKACLDIPVLEAAARRALPLLPTEAVVEQQCIDETWTAENLRGVWTQFTHDIEPFIQHQTWCKSVTYKGIDVNALSAAADDLEKTYLSALHILAEIWTAVDFVRVARDDTWREGFNSYSLMGATRTMASRLASIAHREYLNHEPMPAAGQPVAAAINPADVAARNAAKDIIRDTFFPGWAPQE